MFNRTNLSGFVLGGVFGGDDEDRGKNAMSDKASKNNMRNESTPTNITDRDQTDESSSITSDIKPLSQSSSKLPSDHMKRQRLSHESLFEYDATIAESKNKMKIETESAKERRR